MSVWVSGLNVSVWVNEKAKLVYAILCNYNFLHFLSVTASEHFQSETALFHECIDASAGWQLHS